MFVCRFKHVYNIYVFKIFISGARGAESFDEDASFYPMQNANYSGFYYFEKSDDRAFVITAEGDNLKLTTMMEESDISNYLFSIAGKF